MDDYHHVLGFFEDQCAAESAHSRLVEQGLPSEQLKLFTNDTPASNAASAVDGTSQQSAAEGVQVCDPAAHLGDLAGVALVPENVSLFVAEPLIDSLANMGWAAKLGDLLGPTTCVLADADIQPVGCFDQLVRDATANGQIVLAAQTRTVPEVEVARDVMQISVQDSHDERAMPA